ncbi:MAG: hypothetical protein COA50_08085 [Flavobacteriaceae bacterium]|nr:MAG: hypothetical protein COA50_08085 [Flavobacteriaceae bacterium]
MRKCPTKFINLIALVFVLFLQFACSKDSDLFAEYILDESVNPIENISNEEEEQQPDPDDETIIDVQLGELKAFPTAYGGGSNASGGRGKILAIITSLNRNEALTYHAASGNQDEYYTGGLFTAMQNKNVGYIIFNVSGNIQLGVGGTGAQYGFSGMPGVNNKTIFGQSAPEGGITLTGGTFRLDGSDGDNQNLIFRYLRSRPIINRDGALTTEDDAYTWSFLFYGGNDIIVDHCSTSFAQDKAIGGFISKNTERLENITFSNNLICDSGTGAYTAINPGRDGNPENNVDYISYNQNVIVSVNRTPNLAFNGNAEKINNILHNIPGKQTSAYHALQLNEIGNYYRGSESKNKIREDISAVSGMPLIYTKDNYFEGVLTGKSSENNSQIWTLHDGTTLAETSYFQSNAFSGFPNPITSITPQKAFTNLVTNGDVGAYKYFNNDGIVKVFRDSFDTSQLSIVENNQNYTSQVVSNWILPTIPNNNRPESYDTDNDGMADAWEMQQFGDLKQSYRGDYNGDGYENIEEYMSQVDFQ